MLYRAYLLLVCLSIISCAISVSLSQLFLLLSFSCFLFLKEKPDFRSEILLLLVLFYSWQLTSFLYHAFANGFRFDTISLAWKAEMKDIFLLSAFFVIQAVRSEDRPKITKSLQIFAFVILVTGLIAVFSPIRLSRLISDLYRQSATWPYQHHYGSFMGINLYLPIGLMNTHLTYGGLLSFVFPFFFFTAYDSLKNKERLVLRLLYVSLFLLASLVFLLNNARSSMLGAFFSISLGLYILIFVENEISKRVIKYLTIAFGSLAIVFSLAYLQSPALQKVIEPLFGSEKHTDSGRTFIWDSSFPLIGQNPVFGIGPGAYPKEIEISRKQKEVQHPELAYFYEVTQRGHSHNDYFHLSAIYGMPAAILYLLLGAFITYGISSQKLGRKEMFLCISLSGFFLSGLLQCYFQDDEVLIVFFFLLGYFQMSFKRGESEI